MADNGVGSADGDGHLGDSGRGRMITSWMVIKGDRTAVRATCHIHNRRLPARNTL